MSDDTITPLEPRKCPTCGHITIVQVADPKPIDPVAWLRERAKPMLLSLDFRVRKEGAVLGEAADALEAAMRGTQ